MHPTKIFIMACCIIAATIASMLVVNAEDERYPVLSQHTFEPPFLMDFGTGSIPNWEYGGSTLATENYIRLVPAIQSRAGFIYNTQPVQAKNWRVDLRFQIHNTHSPGADGLAFWYVKKPERTSGPLYGQKEQFKGIGIVFDSYDNNANGDGPSVIAIRGKGDLRAKWDYDNDLLANQLDRCRADFRNAIAGIVTSRITYQYQTLTVEIDTIGAGKFSPCLSVKDLKLPTGYQFQVTAATGGLGDYHDVYSLVTYDLDGQRRASREGTQEGDGESHRKQRHGWYDPYASYRDHLDNDDAAAAAANNNNNNDNSNKKQTNSGTKSSDNIKTGDTSHPNGYDISDAAEHEFFEGLRKKMKHFDDHDATPGTGSKKESKTDEATELSINTQTNLLVLEALEEVTRTVKRSSTKDDINNIVSQITNIISKQQAVQRDLIQMKDQIREDYGKMLQGLSKEAQALHSGITTLETYLNSLNVQVDDLSVKQGHFHRGLENTGTKLQETIKTSTSYGFWIFFILFQTAFVIGFMYYKKYADVRSTKLY